MRWVISLRAEAHATCVNWGKILAAAIHEPAGWRIRHKNFPRIRTSQPASRQMSDGKALIWKQNLVIALDPKDKTWTRSPWTPTLDLFHGPPVMDQVHGYSFVFIERFWTGSMDNSFLNNENWTKTEIVQKNDLTRRCWPLIKSYHQGRNYALQYKDLHYP